MSRPFRALCAPFFCLGSATGLFQRRLPAVLLAVVGTASFVSTAAIAQSGSSLVGRALDANGQPVSHPVVHLVSDPSAHSGATWRYTLIGDSLGKFAQEGLAPGAYLVMLSTDGQASDVLESVRLRAGEAVQIELRPGLRSGQARVSPAGSVVLMAGSR